MHMIKRYSFFQTVLFFMLALLFLVGSVSAQGNLRFVVDEIDTQYFPKMEVYLSVSDAQGLPIHGLVKDNFDVSEGGTPITNFDITPIQNMQQKVSFMLVIDTSGSMNEDGPPSRITNAKQAAQNFIQELSPQDQIGLVTFGQEVKLVQVPTSEHTSVTDTLADLSAHGDTYLYDGLLKAIDELKDVQNRRVIILIADGRDSSKGKNTYEDVIKEATKNNIPIFTLGFGNVDSSELSSMALETGGIPQFDPSSDRLSESFTRVLQILREQYLLRYDSNLEADKQEYDLNVTVDYSGDEYSANRKFIAQPYIPPDSSVSVQILEPGNGDALSVTTTVKAEVVADLELENVQFFVNDDLLGELGEEPFELTWPVQDYASGDYSLRIVATDRVGNTDEDQVDVSVRLPIIMSFASPKDGDVLKGEQEIALNVDPAFTITQIVLSANGLDLVTFTEEPYSTTWKLFDVKNGEYLLKAEAQDDKGHSETTEINVTVSQGGGVDVGGSGFASIAIGFLILLAAILIPIGLRRRKAASGTQVIHQTGTPVLIEIQGKNPNQVWQLNAPEVRLGRKGSENDIPLKGTSASRQMAVIQTHQNQQIVYSLNPDNPAVVNNIPVDREQVLRPGDTLVLGDSAFRYELQ